ncbi:MAG TPA: PH domain-containing protein [Chloroflexota bacterium]|nr:PH domain-containing protein [Chloroflexota bacterium]
MGFAACLLALAATLGAAYWTTQQPVSLAMFFGLLGAVVGVIVTLLVALWTYGYYTLRYQLGPDALAIDWLFVHERLPYRTIDAVYAGQRLAETPRVQGVTWPGYYVGRLRARNLGVLRVFASSLAQTDLTLVLTELGGFAVSPDDAFRTALVERLEQARREPARAVAEPVVPRRRQLGRALADPWLLACALASLIVLLAMLGYVMDRYESLPELLALRLDAAGDPEYVRPRFELFHLPGVGATVLLVNVFLGIWLYQWEPLAARLLWAAPLLVQAVLAIAVLRTIS